MSAVDPTRPVAWYRRLWRLVWDVWMTAAERNIGLVSAGVAFFGMFAIFPAIAAIIAIFGLVADPVVVVEQLALMRDIIPDQTYDLFLGQIGRLLGAQTGTLAWSTAVSIALALWAARAGVLGLMEGLNAIAGRPARHPVKQYVVAMTLTVCLVLLAITALVAVIVAPVVLALAPITADTAWTLELVRWLVAFFVLYAALALLYRFGPNQRGARLRWMTLGAFFAIVLWIGASAGLSYYLANFGRYNEVYGSIGAVIGMLLWLYVTSYLILLGAALNLHVYGRVDGEARTPVPS